MQQNINLLLQLPKKHTSSLTIKLQLIIVASMLLLLLIVYFSSLYNSFSMDSKLNELTTQKNALNKQIDVISQALSLNKTTATTQQTQYFNTEYFSKYLNALAQKTPDGVWLNHLYFSHGLVKEIVLSGGATSEQYLPDYLTTLNTDQTFLGVKFVAISVKKDQKTKAITFVAQSTNRSS